MQTSTTVRVATSTRDSLRELADADGVTLDETVSRLVRNERQRRMGAALASRSADDDETWLTLGARTVGDEGG